MRLRPHQSPADGRRALVTRYSLQRNSRHADVRIIDADDHPFLAEREGQAFLRDGERRVWRYDDLQSFARATVLAGWRTSGTISARRRWLPAAPEFQAYCRDRAPDNQPTSGTDAGGKVGAQGGFQALGEKCSSAPVGMRVGRGHPERSRVGDSGDGR